MRKKYEIAERPICNAVTVFRERGNYLQRLEQFEKSIQAYNEALRWNNSDVRSLLGRSLARVKSTHYAGALADAAQAAGNNGVIHDQYCIKTATKKLAPENLTALQIRAQTEYEKCAFERALVLAHLGRRMRRFPPDFAECGRCAEETVKECVDESANKVLASAVKLLRGNDIKSVYIDEDVSKISKHQSRMQSKEEHQIQEMSLVDKQRSEQISRLMASKYLERMSQEKYFLTALCKDERLISANKQGSQKLQDLANNALKDLEKRQSVLRERWPLYAARASEANARTRLSNTRKAQISRTQKQNENDAKRLIQTAQALYKERKTNRCIEQANFGMEQISRKPANMLPAKEKYLQALQDIIANAFLDQKRVRRSMSEMDREKRAYVLLGMSVSREPSRDSVLRVRPLAPPRDAGRRLRNLERSLSTSIRESERCYLLHELARLLVDTKQGLRARFYAVKCQAEAKSANQRIWLLNATFLLARCHLLQNNRPEARAVLLEGAGLARSYDLHDIAEFYDTCASIALEGEVGISEAPIERREKDMVSIMQDDDLRSEAKHLFKRMSVLPAARRFSIIPGAAVNASVPLNAITRRISIIPRSQQPTKITRKFNLPLGFQEFDI